MAAQRLRGAGPDAVFSLASDPVGAGYVDSLARLGGNAIGFMLFEYSIVGSTARTCAGGFRPSRSQTDRGGSVFRPLLPARSAVTLPSSRFGQPVTAEAERRGWLPPSRTKEKPTADGRPQHRQAPAEHGTSSLTTGKLNAVRSAFKAGVKPSAIARQFGISQSDVSKALATESRDRKSGR
jgi:hypothetical protein